MTCLDELIKIIKTHYELEPVNTSEYDGLKINGMRFDIKAYEAKNLGHISVMTAKGLFGLMKMDTIIITPSEADLPLLSYDRIKVMGNDILIAEPFDTVVDTDTLDNLDRLEALVSKYDYLPYRDMGKHWYDDIKLSGCMSFKGKKNLSSTFNALAKEYLETYLSLPYVEVSDVALKKQKTLNYVNDLIENGGPSTNVFIKAIGKEKTKKLFYQVLFGV